MLQALAMLWCFLSHHMHRNFHQEKILPIVSNKIIFSVRQCPTKYSLRIRAVSKKIPSTLYMYRIIVKFLIFSHLLLSLGSASPWQPLLPPFLSRAGGQFTSSAVGAAGGAGEDSARGGGEVSGTGGFSLGRAGRREEGLRGGKATAGTGEDRRS